MKTTSMVTGCVFHVLDIQQYCAVIFFRQPQSSTMHFLIEYECLKSRFFTALNISSPGGILELVTDNVSITCICSVSTQFCPTPLACFRHQLRLITPCDYNQWSQQSNTSYVWPQHPAVTYSILLLHRILPYFASCHTHPTSSLPTFCKLSYPSHFITSNIAIRLTSNTHCHHHILLLLVWLLQCMAACFPVTRTKLFLGLQMNIIINMLTRKVSQHRALVQLLCCPSSYSFTIDKLCR